MQQNQPECDNSATGNDGADVQQAQVNDNPSSTQSGGSVGSDAGSYTGTLSGTVTAQLSADGSTWVTLAPPSHVTLALQSAGSATQLSTSATVPVGTYAYARLVFSPGAQATVTGTIGGTSYSGSVVTFGSGQLVIERQVQPVTVSAGSTVRVVWDLNSKLWLTTTAMQAHSATSAAVSAVTYARVVAN